MATNETQQHSASHAWYCVKSKNKKEYHAATFLRNNGIETYCPRIRFQRLTQRGKVWFQEAFFPGYFFAHFSLEDHYRMVTYAQGVQGLVHFGERYATLPDEEIRALQKYIAADTPKIVENHPSPGDTVRVISGPLKGFAGTVIHVNCATERVRVLLAFLGGRLSETTVALSAIATDRDTRARGATVGAQAR